MKKVFNMIMLHGEFPEKFLMKCLYSIAKYQLSTAKSFV